MVEVLPGLKPAKNSRISMTGASRSSKYVYMLWIIVCIAHTYCIVCMEYTSVHQNNVLMLDDVCADQVPYVCCEERKLFSSLCPGLLPCMHNFTCPPPLCLTDTYARLPHQIQL